MSTDSIEDRLTKFDRSVVRVYNSFEDADQADREFWWSRTPVERLIALEHIRGLAWGYDAENPPRLPRSPELLQLQVFSTSDLR
ncbi:MAG: hypothetical protein H7Z14_21090 [Anaerolineae bacterium]|nr:hypothetical protein [Phycisphaerae bacterium]